MAQHSLRLRAQNQSYVRQLGFRGLEEILIFLYNLVYLLCYKRAIGVFSFKAEDAPFAGFATLTAVVGTPIYNLACACANARPDPLCQVVALWADWGATREYVISGLHLTHPEVVVRGVSTQNLADTGSRVGILISRHHLQLPSGVHRGTEDVEHATQGGEVVPIKRAEKVGRVRCNRGLLVVFANCLGNLGKGVCEDITRDIYPIPVGRVPYKSPGRCPIFVELNLVE